MHWSIVLSSAWLLAERHLWIFFSFKGIMLISIGESCFVYMYIIYYLCNIIINFEVYFRVCMEKILSSPIYCEWISTKTTSPLVRSLTTVPLTDPSSPFLARRNVAPRTSLLCINSVECSAVTIQMTQVKWRHKYLPVEQWRFQLLHCIHFRHLCVRCQKSGYGAHSDFAHRSTSGHRMRRLFRSHKHGKW